MSKLSLNKLSISQRRNAMKGRLCGVQVNLATAILSDDILSPADIVALNVAKRRIDDVLKYWNSSYIKERYGR